jgi:hypothetical protein
MLKKTIIRKKIRDLLKLEVTLVSNRVYSGRTLEYQDTSLFPAISLYNRNETIDEVFQGQSNRSFDLVIVGAISHKSHLDLDNFDFDEETEKLQFLIEQAMFKIKFSAKEIGTDNFNLFENIEYKNSIISFDDKTGHNMGFTNMTFEIVYINSDGIDYSTLPEFDEISSYENIDILELQPISQL